uniref:Uncharacterized protein n=1 Tax=Glossina palpalis gambiensis TaxID=67801 RepID=A0A1B0C0Q2_9MUSC
MVQFSRWAITPQCCPNIIGDGVYRENAVIHRISEKDICDPEDEIVGVVCGQYHIMFLAKLGKVYTYGWGSDDQTVQGSSRCSSANAGFNRDGKLMPIKSSATQLSWNSTKLRTNGQKTMHIKNISNKRLPLPIEVIEPGFQIVSDHGNSTIILHSQESRAITNYCKVCLQADVHRVSNLKICKMLSTSVTVFLYHSSVCNCAIYTGNCLPRGFPHHLIVYQAVCACVLEENKNCSPKFLTAETV